MCENALLDFVDDASFHRMVPFRIDPRGGPEATGRPYPLVLLKLYILRLSQPG